ncbi:MAG: YceI family protein [Candidatus Dadabacteria bacterium]
MKRQHFLLLVFLLATSMSFAQARYFTKTGKIHFISKAAIEDNQAVNRTVTAVLDAQTGAIQFAVQMKGFEFEKQLMQEHFNENYVESDKYPKGEFKGVITNNSDINYSKPGTYTAKVKGKLTIHGVSRDVETTGIIKVDGAGLQANSSFTISLSDYNISIPSIVKDKVSNTIRINVDCKLDPLKA